MTREPPAAATGWRAGRAVLATSNPGKLREVQALLAELPLSLVAQSAFPGIEMPEEGDDYERNAVVKAQTVARATGWMALADDSGLEVDALGGGPGPRSARFGGPGLDDAGRVKALLEALATTPHPRRGARFVCIAALVTPDGEVATKTGECRGRILEAPRGEGGFGYDPVFEPEGHGVSMAELAPSVKNVLSHRAVAFRELARVLRERLPRPA